MDKTQKGIGMAKKSRKQESFKQYQIHAMTSMLLYL